MSTTLTKLYPSQKTALLRSVGLGMRTKRLRKKLFTSPYRHLKTRSFADKLSFYMPHELIVKTMRGSVSMFARVAKDSPRKETE